MAEQQQHVHVMDGEPGVEPSPYRCPVCIYDWAHKIDGRWYPKPGAN